MQQRDAFIAEIHRACHRDKDIVFLSADLGAPALDALRAEFPAQFVHAGISEQNMVNVAVGMALKGKKPYIYAMSPFFLRCFEQLKLAAFHDVPLTVVSVGAGLSYAGAGPTHYATEDIACFRTLVNTRLYTASTARLAEYIARPGLNGQRMKIVRLERGELPELYDEPRVSQGFEDLGGTGIPHLACGYLVHKLKAQGHRVIDVFRINPLPVALMGILEPCAYVYTFEEQYANGGFGSAITDALNYHGLKTRVYRRYLPPEPLYQNGTRDELFAW